MKRSWLTLVWLMSCITLCLSQGKPPIAKWSFESTEKEQRSGAYTLYLYEADKIVKNDGIVGNYLRIADNNPGDYPIKQLQPHVAVTLEFWMRIPEERLSSPIRVFEFSDNSMYLGIKFPNIIFNTSLTTSSGSSKRDRWSIPLEGVGRESFQYYADNQWHHWVIKYDPLRGRKQIWIDGELPDSFSKTLEERGELCSRTPCSKNLIFSHHPKYGDCFVGDLDEVLLYDQFIPRQVHYQHYREGKQGKSYNPKTSQTLPLPKEAKAKVTIDYREYAPGHPAVKLLPLDQLRDFPLPRFRIGHGLKRHYNWMEPRFLGGHKSADVGPLDALQASVDIQEELAVNWNYTIIIHNATTGRTGTNSYVNAWTELANRHPDIPLGITTLWAQVLLTDHGVSPRKKANIISQDLPDQAYIQDAKGQHLGRKGEVNPRHKQISPVLPDKFIIEDAQKQGSYLKTIQKKLTRPINIINENGEVPYAGTDPEILERDPAIVRDKQRLGIQDWAEYQAVKKTHQRSLYRDEMLKAAGLSDIAFSWYGIDGGPTRHPWKIAKAIQTPYEGQHYSTPDFYPRWPNNWYKWAGAWRGWKWFENCRGVEIADGDVLFSPFVAAGWNHDPERNLRPSQYLGLLKNLGVIGAEFFYPGYFNVNKIISNPKNYIWQAAIPGYAQAIVSRYEDVLRNGHILRDAEGKPILRLENGNPGVLSTVRKHNDKDLYIIGTTIQPISNIKGQVQDQQITTIDLQSEKIHLMSRRQGSTYYYDRSDPDNIIFYQLDSWHEAGHPSYWSKDFLMEAEVFDLGQEIDIRTERPANASKGDFSQFTTYLSATGEDACVKFSFTPRSEAHDSFQFRIRARKSGNKAASIEVLLDGISKGEKSGIKSSEWTWYTLSGNWKNLSLESHLLSVHLSESVEIDQIHLTNIP
ncbi:MAG: LamG-like jellyroll fold domain-containing protein [Bacteroidota bacterium]